MTRVVTWVRNSEIDSSVANSDEEEEESFDEFVSFTSAEEGPSTFAGAEAFDDAPPPTFKHRMRVKKNE